MNPMTSPGPTVNSVYVVAPNNGYPVVPGTVTQVPLYPSNQPQIHVISGNPPGLVPAQKVLKSGKVLGAIQILIGLVHIGMGSIMITNLFGHYTAVSVYGGFPFWGGLWLNGSVGLNIFSAICSAVGVILLITDMGISGTYVYSSDYPYYDNRPTGMALSGVLLIFCLLELGIASVSSHFGCQVACCQSNNIPNMCIVVGGIILICIIQQYLAEKSSMETYTFSYHQTNKVCISQSLDVMANAVDKSSGESYRQDHSREIQHFKKQT